jgi:chemotaxis signal transduction protein
VSASLLLRAGTRVLAVPVAAVDEVLILEPPLAAPGMVPAVRGVVPVRGRLVPLAHLGALLAGGPPPGERGAVGVAVSVGARRFVLEVDEASDVLQETPEALPAGWGGRWASAAVRRGGALVPVVDLEWVAARLDGGERTTA